MLAGGGFPAAASRACAPDPPQGHLDPPRCSVHFQNGPRATLGPANLLRTFSVTRLDPQGCMVSVHGRTVGSKKKRRSRPHLCVSNPAHRAWAESLDRPPTKMKLLNHRRLLFRCLNFQKSKDTFFIFKFFFEIFFFSIFFPFFFFHFFFHFF